MRDRAVSLFKLLNFLLPAWQYVRGFGVSRRAAAFVLSMPMLKTLFAHPVFMERAEGESPDTAVLLICSGDSACLISRLNLY
jgi:hypothetical protein